MASKKQWISTALKCAVSGALIYWIFRNTNPGEIFAAMGTANIFLLIIAFLTHFVGHYISALRWRLLLRAQKISTSLWFLIQSYMVGMFFNNLLPSIIGGDAVRAYDSYRLGKSKTDALAVVFVDRFLGLFALMLFALGASMVSDQLTATIPLLNLWVILGVVAMMSVLAMIFFPPQKLATKLENFKFPLWSKLESIILKIINSFLAFKGKKEALLKALWLSVLLQANVVIHYFLVAKALDFPIPFHSFFLIIPLATFIMMIPIGINAIGIRESVFAFFFATYGVSQTEAVAFSWIVYGILLLQGLLGGVVYALRK